MVEPIPVPTLFTARLSTYQEKDKCPLTST